LAGGRKIYSKEFLELDGEKKENRNYPQAIKR